MFGIGGGEWVLILIVALIIFGPKKLPEIGRTLGKTLFEVKKATRDLKTTLEMDVETMERAESAQSNKPDLASVPEVSNNDSEDKTAPETPAQEDPKV